MSTPQTPPGVAIVRTGSANLASVLAAFDRLGAESEITDDPAVVLAAPAVVLPGVGAFGPAAQQLRELGLDEAIRKRVRSKQPVLAICLGMQLLCESSQESPGVPGLGIIPARATRFGDELRVPQMGWNRIAPSPANGCSLLEPGWMYFAHSYRIDAVPSGWTGTVTNYGGPFVSALEHETLLACQFHPELSGAAGLALIERWLQRAMVKETVQC